MKRLGEVLLEHGVINEKQLNHALDQQKRSNDKLGRILAAQGIDNYSLHKTLALQQQIPFINLRQEKPDLTLSCIDCMKQYIGFRLVPWRKEGDITFIALCDTDCTEARVWLDTYYGKTWQPVMATPLDIRLTLERRFALALTEESKNLLARIAPDASAKFTFTRRQITAFYAISALFAWAAIAFPLGALLVTILSLHVLYLLTMLLKALLFYIGLKSRNRVTRSIASLKEHELPVYTILIPLYREEAILPRLFESLRRLDYPASKLDIKLLLEADDPLTERAVIAQRPASNIEIIRVPPSNPRTKPKACNYGLKFARGEYVTIFDAEDQPEPQQLKRAVAAFSGLPPDVICLQAKLVFDNSEENLLTRFFDLEYSILFQALLPGLQKCGIPLPLGGTSNHFDVERLRSLGEWDPYNVTEDADLGIRIASAGYRTQMLDSYTLEEAVNAFKPWVNQRSRWIKGYMQTWLVHMRKPMKLAGTIGPLAFMGFQFFIGISCLAFLTAPLVWVVSICFLVHYMLGGAPTIPLWGRVLMDVNLLLYIALHWQQASLIMDRNERSLRDYGNATATLLFPFYWVLHSLASYKALFQLIRKPHFWEKTMHGVQKPFSACSFKIQIKSPLASSVAKLGLVWRIR